jgi:hypothetical protein
MYIFLYFGEFVLIKLVLELEAREKRELKQEQVCNNTLSLGNRASNRLQSPVFNPFCRILTILATNCEKGEKMGRSSSRQQQHVVQEKRVS